MGLRAGKRRECATSPRPRRWRLAPGYTRLDSSRHQPCHRHCRSPFSSICPASSPTSWIRSTAALSRFPALQRLLSRARTDRLRLRALAGVAARQLRPAASNRTARWRRCPCWVTERIQASTAGCAPTRSTCCRQQSDLVLVESERLEISAHESEALLAAVNRHFADGICLLCTAPAALVPARTGGAEDSHHAAATRLGRSVDALLPQGADALLLHGSFNEIQMLLHDHPVNAAREARGALTVNSLWLWGAGRLARCARSGPQRVDRGCAPRGLARASGLPVHAPPAEADDWLAGAEAGEHWVLLDSRKDPQAGRRGHLARPCGGIGAPLVRTAPCGTFSPAAAQPDAAHAPPATALRFSVAPAICGSCGAKGRARAWLRSSIDPTGK